MDYFFDAYTVAVGKFTDSAEGNLKGAGKRVDLDPFKKACMALLPSDMCVPFCEDIAYVASDANAVGGVSLGSPTYEELLVMITAKREEVKQAEGVHKECTESVTTITRLRSQFVKNTAVVKTSTRSVGSTSRRLRMKQTMLKRVMIKFHAAVEEDKKARAALALALEQE